MAPELPTREVRVPGDHLAVLAHLQIIGPCPAIAGRATGTRVPRGAGQSVPSRTLKFWASFNPRHQRPTTLARSDPPCALAGMQRDQLGSEGHRSGRIQRLDRACAGGRGGRGENSVCRDSGDDRRGQHSTSVSRVGPHRRRRKVYARRMTAQISLATPAPIRPAARARCPCGEVAESHQGGSVDLLDR